MFKDRNRIQQNQSKNIRQDFKVQQRVNVELILSLDHKSKSGRPLFASSRWTAKAHDLVITCPHMFLQGRNMTDLLSMVTR